MTGKGFSLDAYEWSDELAISAQTHLSKMYGCDLHPNYIAFDGNDHENLLEIAQFDNHQRLGFVSNRFIWDNPQEAAFDILLDDESYAKANQLTFFSNSFNQIGVACSCS